MIQTILFFIPVFACLFWALIHAMFAYRTDSFGALVLFLLALSAFMLTDAVYASNRSPISNLVQMSVLAQLVGPAIIPLLIIYMNKLYLHARVRAVSMIWLLVTGGLFAAGVIVYQVVGAEQVEFFVQDYYNRGIRVARDYKGTQLYYYYLWGILAYDIAIAIEIAIFFFYLWRVAKRQNYRFVRIWAYLFKGEKIAPLGLQFSLVVPAGVLIVVREVLFKPFVNSHQWLSVIGSIALFVLISAFSYVALFGAAPQISIRDMRRAFRYNHPSGEEDLFETSTSSDNEDVSSPRSLAADIFSEGKHFAEDDSLRARFQHLMVDEQLFLIPGLSLGDLAERLHSNKTYVSRMVNTTYNIGFPELLNTLRVDYAEQYILSHPDALQEEVAKACGFLSASSFNNIFKKVTGVTPKVWLGTHRRNM